MKNERSLVYLLITTSLFCLLASSCSQKMESTSFTAMNTYMTVKSYGTDAKVLSAGNYLVQQEVEWLESILSTTIEGSDIYEINNSDGEEIPVSDETVFLIERGSEFYKKTDGAFNPALYPVIKEWGFTTGDYKVPSEEKIRRLLEYTDFSRVKIPVNISLNTQAEDTLFSGRQNAELTFNWNQPLNQYTAGIGSKFTSPFG